MRQRLCEDCEADLRDRVPQAKLCRGCAKRRSLESTLASNARRLDQERALVPVSRVEPVAVQWAPVRVRVPRVARDGLGQVIGVTVWDGDEGLTTFGGGA